MASSKSSDTKKSAKAPSAPEAAKKDSAAKKPAKSKQKAKNAKPGLIERAKTYFAGVRAETKRVIWPTRDELVKYTFAVLGMLLFFGILIAVVDAAVVPVLYMFSGLRG